MALRNTCGMYKSVCGKYFMHQIPTNHVLQSEKILCKITRNFHDVCTQLLICVHMLCFILCEKVSKHKCQTGQP